MIVCKFDPDFEIELLWPKAQFLTKNMTTMGKNFNLIENGLSISEHILIFSHAYFLA